VWVGEAEEDRVGNEDERTAFCRREFPRLVGALTLYCGDADVAQELAQETLARACQRWRRVRELDLPGAWAYRVGLNLANSHFRRARYERTARQRVGMAREPATSDTDAALTLRAAVAALPRRQRTALVLRYFVDLPVAEVARLMSCREGTVKALTAQAIASLRRDPRLGTLAEVVDV
jgi:RNA polymerase sigma-70 factor (ECF subfamily)